MWSRLPPLDGPKTVPRAMENPQLRTVPSGELSPTISNRAEGGRQQPRGSTVGNHTEIQRPTRTTCALPSPTRRSAKQHCNRLAAGGVGKPERAADRRRSWPKRRRWDEAETLLAAPLKIESARSKPHKELLADLLTTSRRAFLPGPVLTGRPSPRNPPPR